MRYQITYVKEFINGPNARKTSCGIEFENTYDRALEYLHKDERIFEDKEGYRFMWTNTKIKEIK